MSKNVIYNITTFENYMLGIVTECYYHNQPVILPLLGRGLTQGAVGNLACLPRISSQCFPSEVNYEIFTNVRDSQISSHRYMPPQRFEPSTALHGVTYRLIFTLISITYKMDENKLFINMKS